MTQKDTEPGRTRSFAFEGLMTVCLTLCAYAGAFCYEAGYCSYFGIPIEMIELDITRLLVVGAGCVIGVFVIITFAPILGYQAERKLDRLWHRILLRLSFYGFGIFGLVFCCTQIGLPWSATVTLLRLTIIIIVLSEVVGLVWRRIITGAWFAIRNSLWDYSTVAMLVIFSILGLPTLAGGQAARKQTDFLCTEEARSLVLLRRYGSRIICADLSIYDMPAKPRFFVLTPEKLAERALAWRRIGPFDLYRESSGIIFQRPKPSPPAPQSP